MGLLGDGPLARRNSPWLRKCLRAVWRDLPNVTSRAGRSELSPRFIDGVLPSMARRERQLQRPPWERTKHQTPFGAILRVV
jgi:hypothetical protein